MIVAGIQMDIQIADSTANLESMRQYTQQAVELGAKLVVFPECTTTGYCFDSQESAFDASESIDGESVRAVVELCKENDIFVVFGFLERDGNSIFNSAALVGSGGIISCYRKTHLPFLGVDRFVTPGSQCSEIVSVEDVKIGLGVCYDSSFPEYTRDLALRGVDLIVLPTNWPPTSLHASSIIPAARAMENSIYFMAINRIGLENGVEFIGQSGIYDPFGQAINRGDVEPAVLTAEIDTTISRRKHIVTTPGAHEVHRFRDRRPDLYLEITKPTQTN